MAAAAANSNSADSMRAILSAPEARGKESVALYLAYSTNLSAAEAIAGLGRREPGCSAADAM